MLVTTAHRLSAFPPLHNIPLVNIVEVRVSILADNTPAAVPVQVASDFRAISSW